MGVHNEMPTPGYSSTTSLGYNTMPVSAERRPSHKNQGYQGTSYENNAKFTVSSESISPSGKGSSKNFQTQTRYYPKDKKGNYDEWAAILTNQVDTAERVQKEKEQEKKEFRMTEFGKSEYLKNMADRQIMKKELKDQDEVWRIKNDSDLINYMRDTYKNKIDNRKKATSIEAFNHNYSQMQQTMSKTIHQA